MTTTSASTTDHLIDQQVIDGQAGYTKSFLNIYDLAVFKGTAPLAWHCSPAVSRQMYDTCLGANHVEIGVGTGYLLDNATFPVADPKITLVDLNPNSLAHTAQRLNRYDVTTVRANVLEPLPLEERAYDSVGMSYLLHCVPGSIKEKGIALKHAAAVVRPGGVVFGATVLSSGVPVSARGRWTMNYLNKRGDFHNQEDNYDDLRDQLAQYFPRFQLTSRGCVGIWRAWTTD
ncbi:class I SAM-dependent methyltransferase [Streptomyces thioluteus]|uniref:Demethylluteothin O-methyltransferase n=2 Tax=Streptomyces thioluteus TaxID=66431 RepID=AURI_STRTU|nr:O-methyl transferase [Streptomyces thioluteus]